MILASGKLGNSDTDQGALSALPPLSCVARDALRFIQPALSVLVKARPRTEGSRQHIGALLLGYYDDPGQLTYAGRAANSAGDLDV